MILVRFSVALIIPTTDIDPVARPDIMILQILYVTLSFSSSPPVTAYPTMKSYFFSTQHPIPTRHQTLICIHPRSLLPIDELGPVMKT